MFLFEINKTLAAVTYLLRCEGGKSDIFPILKMVYLADRQSLIKWGRPITGDEAVSMNKGPVPSMTYNLMKGESPSFQEQWNQVISPRQGNSISVIKDFDTGYLSEREISMLESARKLVNSMPRWSIAQWLHDNCPEWTDPKGSSIPIDPKQVLRISGKSEEEISIIERENQALSYTKFLISDC